MYKNYNNHNQNKRYLAKTIINVMELVGFIALCAILYVEFWIIGG